MNEETKSLLEKARTEAETLRILAEAFTLLAKNPLIREAEIRKLMLKYGLIDQEKPVDRKF